MDVVSDKGSQCTVCGEVWLCSTMSPEEALSASIWTYSVFLENTTSEGSQSVSLSDELGLVSSSSRCPKAWCCVVLAFGPFMCSETWARQTRHLIALSFHAVRGCCLDGAHTIPWFARPISVANLQDVNWWLDGEVEKCVEPGMLGQKTF